MATMSGDHRFAPPRRFVVPERMWAAVRITSDDDGYRSITSSVGALLPDSPTFAEISHPEELDALIKALATAHATGEPTVIHHRLGTDHHRWSETTVLPDGLAMLRDITAELHQLEQLARAEQRFRRAIDRMVNGAALVAQDGRVIYANDTWHAITDGADHVLATVRDPSTLTEDTDGNASLDGVSPDGRRRLRVKWFDRECADGFATVEDLDESIHGHRTPLTDDGIDSVTGLLSRQGLLDTWSSLTDEPVAVIVADLDGFRNVNREHGDAIGDLILREIGLRFRTATRPGDALARLSGDEFALICRGVANPLDLISLATRLRDSLEDDVEFDDPITGPSLWPIGASLGAVLGFADEGATELLRKADAEMHRDRSRRRDEIDAEIAQDDAPQHHDMPVARAAEPDDASIVEPSIVEPGKRIPASTVKVASVHSLRARRDRSDRNDKQPSTDPDLDPA
jgi:diguanylate cyclase (GGDEF)-like protein